MVNLNYDKNRIDLLVELLKETGYARDDKSKQYLSREEIEHLLTWIKTRKEQFNILLKNPNR